MLSTLAGAPSADSGGRPDLNVAVALAALHALAQQLPREDPLDRLVEAHVERDADRIRVSGVYRRLATKGTIVCCGTTSRKPSSADMVVLLFIVWPTLISLGPGSRALDEVTIRMSCWRGYGALTWALPRCGPVAHLCGTASRGPSRHLSGPDAVV